MVILSNLFHLCKFRTMPPKSCKMCKNPRGRAKGPTALMKAAENGHDTCLDALIQSGANVNVSDPIFTAHKRSCGKVMFSQACVKNAVHSRGGIPGQTPPGRQTPSLLADTPPLDGYCRRRYASYWNAFLLKIGTRLWLVSLRMCILNGSVRGRVSSSR